MAGRDSQADGGRTGNADGAGYSSAGNEPLASGNPQLSEPYGGMVGHADGAPYSAPGHGGPVSTTVHEAESYRQSQIAAHEALQHDAIGNAIASGAVMGVFGMVQAMGEAVAAEAAGQATNGVARTVLGGELGVIGKAAFGGAKEAAKEGVAYTFTHMNDPSAHAPDGGAGRAEQQSAANPPHDPGLSHDAGSSHDAQMSHDPGMSYDPGMSQDPGMSYDPGMSHDDPGYFHQ